MSGKFENNNKCIIPTAKTSEAWRQKHLNNLKLVKIDHDVILTGSSLIAGMSGGIPIGSSFNKFMLPISALETGDKVENVLYRIKTDEFSNQKSKILVILIGTNNTEHNKPYDIYEEIMVMKINCVCLIEELLPNAHIIVPTVLPRGKKPNGQRDFLREINTLLTN
ncbi:platelet-activating factor acetylhydrolase IB subunit beta homolog [Ctenocephalides felis]|uniref:platelet-activating factor acetylhydrolase IB subunit beta homolog n=1 Tax=Ctenocephalides felis TaxID=7515 RepID=UPI000E6E2058|nr:platelet-activating factor acetylhydrolase IB subunit beta homolog [Ctenocephalides felis]